MVVSTLSVSVMIICYFIQLLPSNCSIKDCMNWGRDRRQGVADMSGSGNQWWWSVVVN